MGTTQAFNPVHVSSVTEEKQTEKNKPQTLEK